jgi:hypothetical protein
MVQDLAQEDGAAGQRPRAEEGYKKSRNAKKRAKRQLVAAGNGPTDGGNAAQSHFAGALGQRLLPARSKKNADNGKANHGAKKRAQQDCEEGAAESEERAHHEHHFDVAEAHTIAVAHDFVKPRRKPEQACTEDRSEQSIEDARSPARQVDVATQEQSSDAVDRRDVGGEDQAKPYTEPVHDVRENSFAEIGYDKNDQDAGKEGPLQSGKRQTETQVARDEKKRGEEFDSRVHGRNRGLAIAAFAAQHKPADDGDVVIRLDAAGTVGAAGTRGHNRRAFGNPRDADV